MDFPFGKSLIHGIEIEIIFVDKKMLHVILASSPSSLSPFHWVNGFTLNRNFQLDEDYFSNAVTNIVILCH